MIILDTNVLSELVRGSRRADRAVIRWVRHLTEQPVTTAVNRAELLAGVALLPAGQRRTDLMADIQQLLADIRICLPFDTDASAAYAEVVAARNALGRPVSAMDALIAAVGLVNDAGVATRDSSGFEGVGLRVVDPWTA